MERKFIDWHPAVPRASGDKPRKNGGPVSAGGRSPRERG
ncbi:hypothetical protein BN126_4157 [Cronobacter sakazakii 680]|nr:hypothetical protein BN126_4157 [Cronobacter sakazakii 680]